MSNVTFNIQCTMDESWVDTFCSFLNKMQYNGTIGHTETMRFDCDGDGDFHPKFLFDRKFEEIKPTKKINHDAVHKIEHGYWPEELIYTK